MSRCFPYPPPGYTLRRANNDALIESIKLQKEKEKTREHKKERRSEKKEKEKRKVKKDKLKHEKDNQNKKWHLSDISPVHKGPMHKGNELEAEQLERSNLTQEHGLPVFLEVLPTSSAESTDTSNKRKRNSSPANDSRTHGNIIRIKLASKKQKMDSNTSYSELRVISKLEIMNPTAQNKDSKNDLIHGRRNFHLSPRTNREQICSTSRPAENLTNGESLIPPLSNAVTSSIGRKERKYNELMLNLSPPQLLQQNLDVDDLDWLLRKPEVSAEKSRTTKSNGVSCLSSSALMQPCAQLLNEVNMYALPFTVPF